MEKIITTLQAVINTLRTVKTDNADGNWQKLLGCENAITQILNDLAKKEADADAAE